MVQLTKAEIKNIANGFKRGYDYNTWESLVEILKAKNEEPYMISYIDNVVFGDYISLVDIEDPDPENVARYDNVKEFIKKIYKISVDNV